MMLDYLKFTILVIFSSTYLTAQNKWTDNTPPYPNELPFDKVVIATVITDEGPFNLNISVEFLASTGHVNRTATEIMFELDLLWKKTVIDTVYKNKVSKVSEIPELKNKIDEGLKKLIDELKKTHGIPKSVEIDFTITHFFLNGIFDRRGKN
jgi:hypothetical protein